MEVMDAKEKFSVNYLENKFKIFKVKDKYKLLAVNKKTGKSKTLFTGSKEDCDKNKEYINEAYKQGCIFYFFDKEAK